MAIYSGQLLRVNLASGEVSSTFLTVTDTDSFMQSRDLGTIYNLCGLNMAAPPVLDMRQISGTLLDGSAYSYTVAHFNTRGKDFYILPAIHAPEAVATVATSTPIGPVTPFQYVGHGQTAMYGALQSGRALAVQFGGDGHPLNTSAVDAMITDTDGVIQVTAKGAYGVEPQLLFGPDFSMPIDLDATDLAARHMVVVRVFYTGTNGDGSFVALRLTTTTDAGTQALYLPRANSINLDQVVAYTRERLLPDSVDGLTYADFGFGTQPRTQTGTAAGEMLTGTVLHDRLIGNGGADILVGGLSADRLEGGIGADILHGGAQDDTMIGGSGNDGLFGGNDNDSILGGLGNDTMTGNWGEDILFGGEGQDRLAAGSDNDQLFGGGGSDLLIGFEGDDLLNDGTGADVLNGGIGADTFVLVTDGSSDRILDFGNGDDRIDLDASFANLTITTLSAGRVQILHNGEVLLVEDIPGLLTAADLTAADFI